MQSLQVGRATRTCTRRHTNSLIETKKSRSLHRADPDHHRRGRCFRTQLHTRGSRELLGESPRVSRRLWGLFGIGSVPGSVGAGAVVGHDALVDLACEESFEAADDVFLDEAFGGAAGGGGGNDLTRLTRWTSWIALMSYAPEVARIFRISIVITELEDLAISAGHSHIVAIPPYPEGVRGQTGKPPDQNHLRHDASSRRRRRAR